MKTKIIDTVNHCLGCATFKGFKGEPGSFFDCSYSEYNTDGSCPCCMCIVKPMCLDDCHEYRVWFRGTQPKIIYKKFFQKNF